MARNKYPEQTVQKILDISYRLFLEKGYEETSIQDIVNELGMSKGAIYHHFASKEEILQAINQEIYYNRNTFERILDDESLSGLDKLRKVFLEELGNLEKRNVDKMLLPILKNSRFLSMMVEAVEKESAPIIKKFLIDGNHDGSLHVKDPKAASEVIMVLINIWMNPMIFDADERMYERKLLILRDLMDTIGVPILDDEVFDVAMRYFKHMLN